MLIFHIWKGEAPLRERICYTVAGCRSVGWLWACCCFFMAVSFLNTFGSPCPLATWPSTMITSSIQSLQTTSSQTSSGLPLCHHFSFLCTGCRFHPLIRWQTTSGCLWRCEQANESRGNIIQKQASLPAISFYSEAGGKPSGQLQNIAPL